MRHSRIIRTGMCYHLVTRVAHRAFFLDDEEKDRLLDLLLRAAEFSCMELLDFCIMTNHLHIYVRVPEQRDIGDEELFAKIRTLYRGTHRDEVTGEWERLKKEDAQLSAQPNGKVCASPFDDFKQTFKNRMFHPSEFMKTLKQHCTMSFNGRCRHTGTLWESRFSSRESKPTTADMSAILAYIDCNPVEGGICSWPTAYKWCGWAMAVNGDIKARQMYEKVYGDAAEDWDGIVALHEAAIKKRIGEIEEERRNERQSGADRAAPAGVRPVEMPQRYAIQLEQGKPEVAEAILNALKDKAMSAAEIGLAVGMKSRHRLITSYLQPLLRMEMIVQTLPDSPRAPNQKYKLNS